MDFNKLTLKSQEAVAAAQELARRMGNPELYPEHLLVALLDQELPRELVDDPNALRAQVSSGGSVGMTGGWSPPRLQALSTASAMQLSVRRDNSERVASDDIAISCDRTLSSPQRGDESIPRGARVRPICSRAATSWMTIAIINDADVPYVT